jgi:tetratricopeptide (TPR) repeat protein
VEDSLRHRTRYASVAFLSVASLFFSNIILAGQQNSTPPTQSSKSPKPTRHDSVDVTAKLSPEEVDEGRLNDLYQPIAQLRRKGDCTPQIVQRYQSEVIPAAEKSAFNVPKNKFLFLANTDVGICYLGQQKFSEAEMTFRKALENAAIWPGTNDSAYPITVRQIATAEMGQQRWAEAQELLLKSITLIDPQIAAGEKSDAELNSHFTRNYRGSQSKGYSLLAMVYFREGRTQDALATMEKAYDEVSKFNLDAAYFNDVVTVGRRIADASGDSAARQTWSQRNLR